MKKIKVLIVDDSAVVRRLLKEVLSSDLTIEVVGAAMDPYVARRKIKELNPDVLTLDVEMPKMNGLNFLGNLMRLRPMPVVMVSSQTKAGAETTLKALELGAVDFICKPGSDDPENFEGYRQKILEKVKTAAQARIQNYSDRGIHKIKDAIASSAGNLTSDGIEDVGCTLKNSAKQPLEKNKIRNEKINKSIKVIAIGASTGGTEAIKNILQKLPPDTPPVILVQHIPKTFSAAFAKSANSLSAMNVVEAKDGQRLEQGWAYVAPGDRHLSLRREGERYFCVLDDGPKVNRHKPSVDVMFRSMAKVVVSDALGILLTGMGGDGARGLLEMLESGALTIVQDQATSVVWGMPGEAVRLGAATRVVPLNAIAEQIISMIMPTEELV